MGDRLSTVWILEPPTKAKHDLLCRYLGGWFPILSRWRGRVVFLNGFALASMIKVNGARPVLALNTLLDHNHLSRMENCEPSSCSMN